MERTEVMNIEEQDNKVDVTDVTRVEAEETKGNNDFVVGAVVGVVGAMAVSGLVKFVGWLGNKAKAKKNESKKQTKEPQDAEYVVLDDGESEESED